MCSFFIHIYVFIVDMDKKVIYFFALKELNQNMEALNIHTYEHILENESVFHHFYA